MERRASYRRPTLHCPSVNELLLLRRLVFLAPFFAVRLHFVPLLLLIGIEDGANLRVGALSNVHHFCVAILL